MKLVLLLVLAALAAFGATTRVEHDPIKKLLKKAVKKGVKKGVKKFGKGSKQVETADDKATE